MSKLANKALLTFDTDKWGFMTESRKQLLKSVQRAAGHDDKMAVLQNTLSVVVKHAQAKHAVEKANAKARAEKATRLAEEARKRLALETEQARITQAKADADALAADAALRVYELEKREVDEGQVMIEAKEQELKELRIKVAVEHEEMVAAKLVLDEAQKAASEAIAVAKAEEAEKASAVEADKIARWELARKEQADLSAAQKAVDGIVEAPEVAATPVVAEDAPEAPVVAAETVVEAPVAVSDMVTEFTPMVSPNTVTEPAQSESVTPAEITV